MNSLAILCLFGLTLAGTILYSHGDLYEEGCPFECEEGTYCHESGCGTITPEPTCDDPNPKTRKEDYICAHVITACYCNPPTVRHPETDKCVPLEECPK